MSVSALTWLTTVRTLPAATPVRYCTSRLPSKQLLPPVLLVLISTEAGVRGCVRGLLGVRMVEFTKGSTWVEGSM